MSLKAPASSIAAAKGVTETSSIPKASESRFRANWVMTLNDTKNVK